MAESKEATIMPFSGMRSQIWQFRCSIVQSGTQMRYQLAQTIQNSFSSLQLARNLICLLCVIVIAWQTCQWTPITTAERPFSGEPVLASVYWSKGWWRWWVVTTGAIRRAKLQSNHQQQTNIQCFTGRSPSCRPTNSVKALKGNISHSIDLLTPSSPGVFQLCMWPLIAPGYLGEGCHATYQPSDASTSTYWRLLMKLYSN